MAETPSTMIPLGTRAPDFHLLDVISQKYISLADLKINKALVIIFICNHCPYVKLIQTKLVEVAQQYLVQGIQFIAISSNDAQTYPQDGPEPMRMEALNYHYPFPYLYDETQSVARAYHAACTPDFFVFDHALKCVYRGRFDEATPANHQPVTGSDLTKALDAILTHQPISPTQHASLGCNIKWK